MRVCLQNSLNCCHNKKEMSEQKSAIKAFEQLVSSTDGDQCMVPVALCKKLIDAFHELLSHTDILREDRKRIKKEKTKAIEDREKVDETFHLSREKTKILLKMIHDLVLNQNYSIIHLNHVEKELTTLKHELESKRLDNPIYPIIALAQEYVRLRKQVHHKSLEDVQDLL